MPSQFDIESFLKDMKTKLEVFDVAFRSRDKNLTALGELEITPIKRKEILRNLVCEDYCSGPKTDIEDPDNPDYYEFGKMINGIEVYIKLSLGLQNKMIDCISFHPAEWPLKYPLKSTTS